MGSERGNKWVDKSNSLGMVTIVWVGDKTTRLAFQCPRMMTQEEAERAILWVRQNRPDYIRKGLSTEIQLPDGFFS